MPTLYDSEISLLGIDSVKMFTYESLKMYIRMFILTKHQWSNAQIKYGILFNETSAAMKIDHVQWCIAI
jgi:hypothetical protein